MSKQKKHTEAARQDGEEKYRRLKANIPGMVYLFVMHPDGTFSFPYVNEASRQLFDISPEDLMRDANHITKLIHPDDRNRFDTSVKHSAETLQPWREVLRHIVHGEVRWYDCMSRPELQPNGDILWDGIILEVTDRMKAEESLRRSQKELSDIISVSPVGIAIYDNNGQCISSNDSLARIIGATKQEVLEQNYNQIKSWEKTGLLNLARTAVRTQSVKRREVVTISSFGKEVFLDCHLVPFGEKGLLFMSQDITERKQWAETLFKSEATLRSIYESSPMLMGVVELTEDDKIFHIYDNPATARFFNVPYQGTKHKTADELGAPSDAIHEWLVAYRQSQQKGKPVRFEYVHHAPDGPLWLSATVSVIGPGRNGCTRFSYVAEDITERKRAEETLRKALRSLNNSQKLAKVGSWDWDIQTGEVEWSDEVYRLFGLDPDKFQPQIDSIMSRFQPGDRKLYELLMAAIKNREQYSFEASILLPDGNTRILFSTSEGRLDDNGNLIQIAGTVQDITERKQSEEELRRAKAYSEKLLESANAMIMVLDAEGKVQVFNKAAEKITGYARKELLGREWFEILVPKDKYPKVWERFQKSARDGFPISFENPILTKTGEERFISWQNTELLEDGVFRGSISYGIDITERKQLEEQLLQTQKMEAIGQLAGGVAHDFNNMLSVILGHAELIKSGLPLDHPLLKNTLEIEKAGLHSRDITRQLLAFSRKQIIAPKTINLNQLIKKMTMTLSKLIGENIDLRFIPERDLSNVRFDPSQIDQILINLAVNARDAMPDGGILTIETSNVYLDETYCSSHAECRPGHYVLLIVADDGVGMDKKMLSHVFEPFFTTKEVGKGTGLGLATVYGIVKQNGGFINTYSEPEKGTTFKIYIPRIVDEGEEDRRTEEIPLAVRSGTVLLVEDDDMVRRMTAEVLKKLGYLVVTAETPLEALTFFEKEDKPIDLLIADVVMPQMSGTELHDKIKMIKPGLKVLFMSGYTENVIVRHGVLKEDVHFVQKPFSMHDFARKVREVIENK